MTPAKYRLTWWGKNHPMWATGFQEAVRELEQVRGSLGKAKKDE